MRVDVVMPQMGESVAESTITKWYKNVGDRVERDEELLELSADKVDADVPSPVSGVVVEILYKQGETVEVNTKIAVIETEGSGEVADTSSPSPATSTSAPTAETQQKQPVKENGKPSRPLSCSQRKDIRSCEGSEHASAEELRRTRSTPLVRRIAAEHGITSLSDIEGTGLSGRVTRDDILAYISESHQTESSKSSSNQYNGRDGQDGMATSHQATATHSSCDQSQRDRVVGREIPQLPPVKVYDNDRVETLSPQRQAIARHMIASRATSPHAQTIHEVDFSAVFAHRRENKREFAERGAKLTFTSYLVAALAKALAEFPLVNCSLDGNSLILRGDINIGVAVDVGDSLVVPVIKRADELSLLGISRAIEDLANRARNKKLTPDDMQAGTFTLSNHGIFGPEFGIPIINQPQTAIMSTGAIKKRVVVDQKTDAIMVRPTSLWCLSFDHRAIDGATADKFMARLRQIIETWS